MATRKEEIRRERKVIQQRVSWLREDDELSGDDDENSRKEEKNAKLARLKDLEAKELGRKLERVTAEGGLSAISEEGTFPPNHEDIFLESLAHTFHSSRQS